MTDKDKNYRRHGARYKARRRAADIMYEAELRDYDPVALVEERVSLARDHDNQVAPVAEYTKVLVAGTAEQLDELDETIARYLSEDWELHRLPAVDRAVLRVMTWEIMHSDDVDAPISVVEGVEIASQYSTDQAPPYIHAVLDDIAQSLSEDNPMNVEVEPDEDDALDGEDSPTPAADEADR